MVLLDSKRIDSYDERTRKWLFDNRTESGIGKEALEILEKPGFNIFLSGSGVGVGVGSLPGAAGERRLLPCSSEPDAGYTRQSNRKLLDRFRPPMAESRGDEERTGSARSVLRCCARSTWLSLRVAAITRPEGSGNPLALTGLQVHPALFTDLYQPGMAQAHRAEGMPKDLACQDGSPNESSERFVSSHQRSLTVR